MCDAKPQAGSLACGLCGGERVKDLLQTRRIDSAAIILKIEGNSAILSSSGDQEAAVAPAICRQQGILDQSEEKLLAITFSHPDRRQGVQVLCPQTNPRLLCTWLQQTKNPLRDMTDANVGLDGPGKPSNGATGVLDDRRYGRGRRKRGLQVPFDGGRAIRFDRFGQRILDGQLDDADRLRQLLEQCGAEHLERAKRLRVRCVRARLLPLLRSRVLCDRRSGLQLRRFAACQLDVSTVFSYAWLLISITIGHATLMIRFKSMTSLPPFSHWLRFQPIRFLAGRVYSMEGQCNLQEKNLRAAVFEWMAARAVICRGVLVTRGRAAHAGAACH